MKKEKDIRVEMTRLEGNVAALVKVDYMDKDAQEHSGLMILDSGSDLNYLAKDIADSVGINCEKESECTSVLTVSGDIIQVRSAQFNFALGGVLFHDKFFIHKGQLPFIHGDTPIIGLLGNKFFQDYRLAIDFSDFTLHTSHVSPDNLCVADCDFFFPMEYGLKYYNLPMLTLGQGDMEIIAMADTGATNNLISAPSLSDDGFQCEFLSTSDTINGLTGNIEAKEAILSFDLQTVKDEGCDVIQRQDVFMVHPQYLIVPKEGLCDEDGEQLQPVEALIGCPFMAKEGWVLDFGASIIYKRKPKYVWDGNIRVDFDEKCVKPEKGKIRFYTDATKVGMPFILLTEGEFAGVVILIDTGSNDNIMFGYTFNQIKDSIKTLEGNGSLYGLDGIPSEVHYAEWGLTFCGKLYEMRFLVKDDDSAFQQLSNDMGFPVAGLIGSRFMVEHGWVIDFAHQEVLIPETDVSVEGFK